jgi:hypothetical protein
MRDLPGETDDTSIGVYLSLVSTNKSNEEYHTVRGFEFISVYLGSDLRSKIIFGRDES